MDKKRIFTFWEPADNLPAYLKLCIKTWEKFLPEYEVVVLDYSNLDEWLGKDFYDKALYEKFSLPKQADAIRCALLNKYGGIWMDTDTIITSSKVRDFLRIDSEFILVGKSIGFIVAKPNSYILSKWQEGVFENLRKFNFKNLLYSCFFNRKEYKRLNNWNYMGNSIIDGYLQEADEKTFYSIDANKNCILPERVWAKENSITKKNVALYRDFYFHTSQPIDFLSKNGGLIYLHNSWTPREYMQMSEEEFLRQENTLASVFKSILGFE